MKLGGIYLSVGARTDQLKRDLAKAKGMTAKTAVLMRQEIGRISFAKVGIAAIAFGATVAFGMKKAIDAASDLEETVGKFNVVFAEHSKQAESMADVLVDSYAMSTREAKQYLSSIQDLLVPMGMAADKAILMSNEVVKLSADLASFNNVPTATAMADIQSALVGNFETMKKYGVVLNETVIKQEALNQGIWNGKGMVDANTKAQIAYQLMLKGSAAALGDQQRTMGSYANQMKQLKANIEDIAAAVGDELLPQVTEWVNQINIAIGQNPEIIKQMGEFAKNILTLAASMGKVIGFGVEFVNVLSKITGAMGLASTGIISWKTAIFDGAATMELFKTELGRAQLRAEKLRKELKKLGAESKLRGFFSKSKREEIARTEKRLKMIEAHINDIINRSKVMAGVIDYASDFSGLPVIDKPPPPAKEDLTKRMAAMKRANKEMQRLFVPDYASDFGGMSLDQELEWAAKTIEIAKETEQERLAIVAQANQQFAELGMTRFDLERAEVERMTELYRQAGVDEVTIARITAQKIKDITKNEQQTKLSIYKDIAGGIADTFLSISQAGGEQSKKAFMAYKAFAMVEAFIAGRMAVLNAMKDYSPPYSFIMAGIAGAAAAVQIGMIGAAQPPSYQTGTNYVPQTGLAMLHEGEKVIPKNRVNDDNKSVQIILNNPVFQDLETQRQTMEQIAEVVAERVAPDAVVNNYQNDGAVRSMVRQGA